MRAIGIKWLAVDPRMKARRQPGAPEKTEPRRPLDIAFRSGGRRQRRRYVTVAAVDVGILNLTRYELRTQTMVISAEAARGSEDARSLRTIDRRLARRDGRLRTGANGDKCRSGSPPTEKLVALLLGRHQARRRRHGECSIRHSAIHTERHGIMAVAWTKSRSAMP